ncbi:MAG: hypothetical protein J6K53_15420 [Roseburia sp.]|nr:hypothetical protein [Roseburia sp.]
MIQLQANPELKQTFTTLIETMKVPVKWNGIFVVIDNYIILQGEVRSLFFHFDTRKVATNIIDIPAQQEVFGTEGNTKVQNAINMILYAFGKWGTIKGLKVEKSHKQLNELFVGVMREFGVEPEYTQMYFRFYRHGMRITYEDVIQMALESGQENEAGEEEKAGGLWRKIVWKKARVNFVHVETTIKERRASRIGNNFYLVGYLCPLCKEKLHMVVYPMGKEFLVETEEGGVLLARAAVCSHCLRFYTPRPHRLFAEGDIYTLDFEEDEAAYGDYLELLGRDGDRVSNYHTNEFADGRAPEDEADLEEELDELCANLPELSDAELRKLAARMEEGFYSDESIAKYEPRVQAQRRGRASGRDGLRDGIGKGDSGSGQAAEQGAHGKTEESGAAGEKSGGAQRKTGAHQTPGNRQKIGQSAAGEREAAGNRRKAGWDEAGEKVGRERNGVFEYMDAGREDGRAEAAQCHTNEAVVADSSEKQAAKEKYEARMKQLDRYSERQLKELKRQLEGETYLTFEEKKTYLDQIKEKLSRDLTARLKGKADACEGKNYAVMKRVTEEVKAADIPEKSKHPILEQLKLWMDAQAKREVEQLIAKMPPNLDRRQYQEYLARLREYEDVDLSPYEEKLAEGREAAERRELANLVKRARKVSREDYRELEARLKEEDFLPELTAPYIARIEEKIRQLDADAIAEICPAPLQMSFEDGMEAYRKLKEGDFLPELKEDALKALSKRLSRIKTDECELLVKKLKAELAEAGIAENARHHFYPARRVLMNQAAPEETELIDFAMASYAAGRGLFEYPILVVDATRNGTGREGMILTPDHLFYSTAFSACGTEIAEIRGISASTGLLNRGLYVHPKHGAKYKIPYAVDAKELSDYAGVLDAFVKYLIEKPDSRKVTYLASEKHDTICCFRCGCEYKGGTVCPKCGYQNNG